MSVQSEFWKGMTSDECSQDFKRMSWDSKVGEN